jgi:hypothetical protein
MRPILSPLEQAIAVGQGSASFKSGQPSSPVPLPLYQPFNQQPLPPVAVNVSDSFHHPPFNQLLSEAVDVMIAANPYVVYNKEDYHTILKTSRILCAHNDIYDSNIFGNGKIMDIMGVDGRNVLLRAHFFPTLWDLVAEKPTVVYLTVHYSCIHLSTAQRVASFLSVFFRRKIFF